MADLNELRAQIIDLVTEIRSINQRLSEQHEACERVMRELTDILDRIPPAVRED